MVRREKFVAVKALSAASLQGQHAAEATNSARLMVLICQVIDSVYGMINYGSSCSNVRRNSSAVGLTSVAITSPS